MPSRPSPVCMACVSVSKFLSFVACRKQNCYFAQSNTHTSPLGNTPYTPWQRVLAREFSAKGILADYVRVAYNKEPRPRFV